MTLDYSRLRLAIERTLPLGTIVRPSMLNVFTAQPPRIVHARALQVELGLFNNGTLALGGLSTITLEVKSATSGVIDTGASLLTRSTTTFNAALTQAEWVNDSGEAPWHAVIQFLDTEIAGISMSGAVNNEKEFGLVLTGVTPAGRIPLASGIITLVQDGGTGAGGVAPVASYTFSDSEILGMWNSSVKLGENAPGASFILRSPEGPGIVVRAILDNGVPRLDWIPLPTLP